MSAALTAAKPAHQAERVFSPADLSEYATRKRYIDLDLKLLGWVMDEDALAEYPVQGMAGVPGQQGFADYVLFGRDGLPLAVVEAKRSCKDANAGKQQAKLYADCLEARFGRRPMMFTTNGFDTFFWDDQTAPQRQVSGLFSRGDLEKLMYRRSSRKPLADVPIDDRITDRYYQKEAIRAICDNVTRGLRKNLLVMQPRQIFKRGKIGDLFDIQRQGLQPAQVAKRRNVRDGIIRKLKRVQVEEPRKRRQVANRIMIEFEGNEAVPIFRRLNARKGIAGQIHALNVWQAV